MQAPELLIGHHQLLGKVVWLEKPYGVLVVGFPSARLARCPLRARSTCRAQCSPLTPGAALPSDLPPFPHTPDPPVVEQRQTPAESVSEG